MSIRKSVVALLLALPLGAFGMQPAAAVNLRPTKIFTTVSATRVLVGGSLTVTGSVLPARKSFVVRKLVWNGTAWKQSGKSFKTDATGHFSVTLTAPATPQTWKLRFATGSTNALFSQKGVTVAAPDPDPILTMNPLSGDQPSAAEVTVSGTYLYAGNAISVDVQYLLADVWTSAAQDTPTARNGQWTKRITLPAAAGPYSLRAVATTSRGTALSEAGTITVLPPPPSPIDALGPGTPSRIWGVDVARYQFQTDKCSATGKNINWVTAYSAGLRFAFIKASDGRTVSTDGCALSPDGKARKWALLTHNDAQNAGIFTGFYHFPAMPDTTGTANNPAILMADARQEAIQAAARLAEVGGYSTMDLPYVLDVESDGIAGSGIADKSTPASVMLWVKTWLQEMQARTGRMPILYSAPVELNQWTPDPASKDPFWQTVPLWIARYSCVTVNNVCTQITHATAVSRLNNGATPGIYNTPWTQTLGINWTFWQYSSVGRGCDYGIINSTCNPALGKYGTSVDMDVFNGTATEFRALTQTVWHPASGEYSALNEPVTLTVTNDVAPANQPVTLNVSAKRGDGNSAVSGELVLTQNGAPIAGATVAYAGIGKWTVTLPATDIGTLWNLQLSFNDKAFGFYADAVADLALSIPSAA